MFKDDFKKANDSIKADEELINKVLSLKDKRVAPQWKRYVPVAAAAALILSVSAAAVPQLLKKPDTNGVISESVAISDDTEMMPDNSERGAENEASVTADRGVSSPDETAIPAASPSRRAAAKNTVSDIAPEPVMTAVPEITLPPQEPVTYELEGVPPQEYSLDTEQKKTIAPEIKPEKVVLSMNSAAYDMQAQLMTKIADSSTAAVDYAAWSCRDYFDYLGIVFAPKVPDDMRLVSHESDRVTDPSFLDEEMMMSVDENGIPAQDMKIFAFDGDGGRRIDIITSKDTTTAQVYLTDSNFALSKVDDAYAVIIGTVDDCRGYMIKDNVSYTVNAKGLSEEELKALLLSLSEKG